MSSDVRSVAIIGGILGSIAIGAIVILLVRSPSVEIEVAQPAPVRVEPPRARIDPPRAVEAIAPVQPLPEPKIEKVKPAPMPRRATSVGIFTDRNKAVLDKMIERRLDDSSILNRFRGLPSK